MPLRDRRSATLLAMAALLGAAFLVYANTFGNAWTYDDFPVIVNNPDIQSWRAFLADSYPGRPLRELTYLLDHALFGLQPAGWHIQNIFWHGLNAVLLFLLVRRLGGEKVVAWAASLLFLVHPLQVEVVANISHRKDSLTLAFSLLAMLAYAQSFAAERRRGLWLAAAFGLAAVALLGKQSAVVLPLVFMAYELACVPRERRFLLRFPALSALVALAGAVAGAVWVFYFGGAAGFQKGMSDLLHLKANYAGPITVAVYYPMVLKSWAFMFLKFAWPTGLALEYTYAVPASWVDPWVLAALAGLAAYGAALCYGLRRRPLLFFALVWAGAFWLPVSNLWPITYFAADRYLYAPSAGVFILVALLLGRALQRPAVAAAALLLVVVPLSVLTWRQNQVWQSPWSLWSKAVEVSPGASFALNNLGYLSMQKGDVETAIQLFLKAADNPYNPNPLDNLGWLYEKLGEHQKAVNYYVRFLTVAGDDSRYQMRSRSLREHLMRRYGVAVE